MSACELYRDYLSAVADGESALVPGAAVEHIDACPDCRIQVEAYRALSERLRRSLKCAEEPRTQTLPRRRALAGGVVAAALITIVAAVTLTVWLTRPDPVASAVAVASKPMQYHASDARQIATWCRQSSGHEMPDPRLSGLTPMGARMDRPAGTAIVTVTYQTEAGQEVHVGWVGVGGRSPGRSVVSREVDGRPALVVTTYQGTAVVSGAPASVLWQTAAAVEAG